jgi:hypothetical protein
VFAGFGIEEVAGYRLEAEEAVFATFDDDEPILHWILSRLISSRCSRFRDGEHDLREYFTFLLSSAP